MEILTAILMPANRRLLFPITDWRALFRAYMRERKNNPVEITITYLKLEFRKQEKHLVFTIFIVRDDIDIQRV